jgi:hypothetical protein
VIIPGEDPAKFKALRADLAAEHRPVGLTEELLVDEVAQHYWRMKRFRALEAQIFRSKGVNENGGTTIDTGNWVQCIKLGLFSSIQRALNQFLQSAQYLTRAPKDPWLRSFRAARFSKRSGSLLVPTHRFSGQTAQRRPGMAGIQSATGMNEAQLMNFFRGAA